MNKSKKTFREFLIACRYSSISFQFLKETFNQVAFFILRFVKRQYHFYAAWYRQLLLLSCSFFRVGVLMNFDGCRICRNFGKDFALDAYWNICRRRSKFRNVKVNRATVSGLYRLLLRVNLYKVCRFYLVFQCNFISLFIS